MARCKFSRSVLRIVTGAALLMLASGTPGVSAADGQPGGRIIKKIRSNRLPNHYAEVVTDQQREEIYKIQDEYQPKIDALKAQLDALNKEKNDKISGVLTADQKKKIEEAAAAGKAKSAKDEKSAKDAKPTAPSKPADKAEDAEKKAEK